MSNCTVCRLRADRYIDHLGIPCCQRSYLGDCPATFYDREAGAVRLRPEYSTTTKGTP